MSILRTALEDIRARGYVTLQAAKLLRQFAEGKGRYVEDCIEGIIQRGGLTVQDRELLRLYIAYKGEDEDHAIP